MAVSARDDSEILKEVKGNLGEDYIPSEDEPYMNEKQQDYFRMLLLEWKRSIHASAGDIAGDAPRIASRAVFLPAWLMARGSPRSAHR